MSAPPPPLEAGPFSRSRFALHGETSARVDGRILRIHCRGPFNLELVQAVGRMLTHVSRELPQDGRYVELLAFRGSLLMSPEAWDLLEAFTLQSWEAGFRPAASLLVVPPETEGRSLLLPRLRRCWSYGQPAQVFECLDDGEAELQRLAALLP
jgi:hypothetical protein